MSVEWFNIPEFEDYEITKCGMIMNSRTGNIIKSFVNREGYIRCRLNRRDIPLHRLLAMTFIPNLDDRPYVQHIDGDLQNNSLDNLRWVRHNKHDSVYAVQLKLPRGVWQSRNRYAAKIKHGSNQYYLGSFDTAEAAASEYELMYAKLFSGPIVSKEYPTEGVTVSFD